MKTHQKEHDLIIHQKNGSDCVDFKDLVKLQSTEQIGNEDRLVEDAKQMKIEVRTF